MTNFKEQFAATRAILKQGEAYEKEAVEALEALGKTSNRFVFIYKTPNMRDYDFAYLPEVVTPEEYHDYILTLLGVKHALEMDRDKEVKIAYIVKEKERGDTDTYLRTVRAVHDKELFYVVDRLFYHGDELQVIREYENSFHSHIVRKANIECQGGHKDDLKMHAVKLPGYDLNAYFMMSIVHRFLAVDGI